MRLNIILFFLTNVVNTLGFCQHDTIESLSIGKRFNGGLIFYIDQTGKHGLIVSELDISAKAEYGCANFDTYANSLDEGEIKTMILVKHCGSNTAAFICSILEVGGYNDWYLPSINELQLLHKAQIFPAPLNIGRYWSSSECITARTKGRSWALDVKSGGKLIDAFKYQKLRVRAIRKF